MPRGPRVAPGGMIFHVVNRANARRTIFATDGDFQAFINVATESLLVTPVRILAYCVLPNHWHFVLWPELDGQLSHFLHHLTSTHVRRWHEFHQSTGQGHIYQGPFKSFPVQDDEHFYTVCRYVERNSLRANLTDSAHHWKWGSCWARQRPEHASSLPLCAWPTPRPSNWNDYVNQPLTEAELRALRNSSRRGSPYGTQSWQQNVATQLGIQHSLRPAGRPRAFPERSN